MGPNLALERWCTSVMRLQDDHIVVLGGFADYDTGTGWVEYGRDPGHAASGSGAGA